MNCQLLKDIKYKIKNKFAKIICHWFHGAFRSKNCIKSVFCDLICSSSNFHVKFINERYLNSYCASF